MKVGEKGSAKSEITISQGHGVRLHRVELIHEELGPGLDLNRVKERSNAGLIHVASVQQQPTAPLVLFR